MTSDNNTEDEVEEVNETQEERTKRLQQAFLMSAQRQGRKKAKI